VPDRLLLTLDGATRVCAAALMRPRPAAGGGEPGGRGWEVVARRVERDGRGQAKILLRLVDGMLAELGRGPEDLGAIVVGTGPGTFTGVRIAVATGRALSLALGIPVLGVSTLAALAAGAALQDRARAAALGTAPAGAIVPVVDAHRGQVFYGLYVAAPAAPIPREGRDRDGLSSLVYVRSAPLDVCGRGSLRAVVDRLDVPETTKLLVVAEEPALVGDLPAGALLMTAGVEPEALVVGQDVLVEPGEDLQGRALVDWLVRALEQTRPVPPEPSAGIGAGPGGPGTPESVTPLYVRSPDADTHILKMRDPFGGDSAGQGAVEQR